MPIKVGNNNRADDIFSGKPLLFTGIKIAANVIGIPYLASVSKKRFHLIASLTARVRNAKPVRLPPVVVFLLKAAVLAGLGWVIYRQVWSKEHVGDLVAAFRSHWTGEVMWLLVAAVALVPVNWGLETQKWRCLMARFIPVSFWQGYRAILAGVAFSLFTPNRMGEYGGRALGVEKRHGWKAVLATLAGSMSQWVVLFGMGFIGLGIFSTFAVFGREDMLPWLLAGGAVLVPALFLLFLHLYRIPGWLQKAPFYGYLHRYLRVFSLMRRYRKKDLGKVLGLAFLRYATYSLQYFLVLHFLGIGVSPLAGFSGIATLFLIQTSLPLPPVIGLFARGEAALFVWGQFSDQSLPILAASFGLFIINLTAPALLGAVVIVQTNINKLLGYEKEEAKMGLGGVEPARFNGVRSRFFSSGRADRNQPRAGQ